MKADKHAARKERNRLAKLEKAATKKHNMALLGRIVVEREVVNADGEKSTVLDFPPAIRTALDGSILPMADRYAHIHPKVAGYGSTSLLPVISRATRQSYMVMKQRPGNPELQVEATVEDASRTFATEVDKILNPPVVEGTPIPIVPMDAAEAAQL